MFVVLRMHSLRWMGSDLVGLYRSLASGSNQCKEDDRIEYYSH
jgi:hypothetical protein